MGLPSFEYMSSKPMIHFYRTATGLQAATSPDIHSLGQVESILMGGGGGGGAILIICI